MAEDKEVNDWSTQIDSKYRLVILAARRSKQLQKGARPRVHPSTKKPTKVALDEVEHGLIRYQQLSRIPGAE
ncbi:MAG TPA: DNA-directed RNA polymerase subunit omega [Blastocatellia bacterium]|nr:DNA-directed RNA polymerase subunit omega [Blastocatellia bacterium]